MPSCSSNAQRERQKPWLGLTRLRRCLQCSRARFAGHVNRRIMYEMHSAADRLTPAPQCTSTPAHPTNLLLLHSDLVNSPSYHSMGTLHLPGTRFLPLQHTPESGSCNPRGKTSAPASASKEHAHLCGTGWCSNTWSMDILGTGVDFRTFIGATCLLDECVGACKELGDVLCVYVCQLQAQVLELGRQLHVLRVVVNCDHPAMASTVFNL